MSVDPCANVMPVLGGFIRRRRPRIDARKEPENVKESVTRRLIDRLFEAPSQRYSHLRARSGVRDLDVGGQKVKVYSSPYAQQSKRQQGTPNLPRTDPGLKKGTKDSYTQWVSGRKDYQDLVGTLDNDYSLKGPAIVMLADENGRNVVGSGSNFDDAMDHCLQKGKGKGTAALDQYLDYGGILFAGDSDYKLKQVICRDKGTLDDAENSLVAQLKLFFEIPDNLHVFVGWSASQDGPFTGEDLCALLGRAEREKRLHH
jgi:hypothetical protein